MNYEMMLLADCVPLLSSDEKSRQAWTPELKQELISYVKSMAEVAEVRSVAYHDIAAVSAAHKGGQNGPMSNLYRAWYLTTD